MEVAVLGATGMVGQRFIEMLVQHPFFELTTVTASERSAGKRYEKVAKWYLEGDMPEEVRGMIVKETDPAKVRADIVFSALPSDAAKKVEAKFAENGAIVASNASANRMEEDIPLLIPEVNPEHMELVEIQKERRNWDGCIITNPNCTIIPCALSLKPVLDSFGLEKVFMVSMQALSGAGYAGVPSMAIVDNVIPFIKGEEPKVEAEVLKILGKFEGELIKNADFTLSASCNRVPTLDGHTESIFVGTKEEASIEGVKKAMADFKALPQKLKLPSAPKKPIHVMENEDRPQPRRDRMREKGMAITVGRVRTDPILDFKYTALGHNTIRGAAGASVLNAELLVKKL